MDLSGRNLREGEITSVSEYLLREPLPTFTALNNKQYAKIIIYNQTCCRNHFRESGEGW